MASKDELGSSQLDDDAKDDMSPLLKSGKDVEASTKESSYDALDTGMTPGTPRERDESRKSLSDSIRDIFINRPQPNPCLHLFYIFEGVAILASLALLATQLIPIIVDWQDVDFIFCALRTYVACFCMIFVLVELQVPVPFLKDNMTFQDYISRGLLMSFIGLIGIEQAYSQRIQDVVKHASSKFHIGWTPLFMQISSWTMVVIGYLYVLMGVMCMQPLRTKLQENYRQRLDEYNQGQPIGGNK